MRTTYYVQGLGSSVSQVQSVCATELDTARSQLRRARRLEGAAVIAGASLTIGAMLLEELGHRGFARVLTALSIIGGATYAFARLTQREE